MKIKGQFLQCPTSVRALGQGNNGNPIIFLHQAGSAVYTHQICLSGPLAGNEENLIF